MVKRLLILVIVASVGSLGGCRPEDSSDSAGASAAVRPAEKARTSHVLVEQTEPNAQSPAIIDPSQATDAESADEHETEEATNTDKQLTGTADSQEPAHSQTTQKPAKTDSPDGHTTDDKADTDKESPPETTADDVKADAPAKPAQEQPKENAEARPVTESTDPDKAETTDNAPLPRETDDVEPAEPDFKPHAADLYEKCKYILTNYVDKHGNVDYRNLRRKRASLIAAVRAFNDIDPREYFPWSRKEKIAFWINAYNILTLKLVVDNYPIKPVWYKITYPPNSIMQINGAWTKHYFDVMGIEYTLREIEREILLGRFKDSRMCFAFSYATLGGALLRNEPYYPDKIDAQLDDQIRKFLADRRGLRINHEEKTIRLSDIFNWYRAEFVAEYGNVRKFRDRPAPIQAYLVFVARYIAPENVRYLESGDYDVKFIRYDWCLNEQATK